MTNTTLHENILRVRAELLAASQGREVFLLPVTKTRSAREIHLLKEENMFDIGESRVQEYLAKKESLDRKFRLHMIGQLQTNKVRGMIEDIWLIHSLDRLSLAREIQRQAAKIGRRVDVLLQLNIADEPQKGGVSLGEYPYLRDEVLKMDELRLRGLMTIAPQSDDPEAARPVFARARRLFEELAELPGVDTLSMGMSGDAYVAAQEGSTMVRIGTALFGAREQP